MRIGGLLLAGGRSTRFGSEKAVFPIGAGVLMDLPLSALRQSCAAVAVSVRPGSGAEVHARDAALACLIDDPYDAEGPLAGIRRGLAWADAEGFDWLAVAPCDAPGLLADHYQTLVQAVQNGASAAVGDSEAGLEPLVSLWPVKAGLAAVEAALSDGRHPAIRRVLTSIGAVPVRLVGYDGANLNAPGDAPARAFTRSITPCAS